jgi:hypothetical protein
MPVSNAGREAEWWGHTESPTHPAAFAGLPERAYCADPVITADRRRQATPQAESFDRHESGIRQVIRSGEFLEDNLTCDANLDRQLSDRDSNG